MHSKDEQTNEPLEAGRKEWKGEEEEEEGGGGVEKDIKR